MKLRATFRRQQLLFAFGFVGLAGLELAARGDVILFSDGRRMEGKVLGVTGSSLQVQTQAGSIGWPLANIKEVQMPTPPEFKQAQDLFAAKDYPKALATMSALAGKYKGVPIDWARQATAMLGDLYVATNELAKAEAAYKEFQKLYPGAGGVQAEVGMARIAASKKDFATAKSKLQPIADAALKEKNVPPGAGFAYSNAFFVLGQIKESEGNAAGALEDYLRTVTLFYHDPAAVSAAQERADAIRKAEKVTVP